MPTTIVFHVVLTVNVFHSGESHGQSNTLCLRWQTHQLQMGVPKTNWTNRVSTLTMQPENSVWIETAATWTAAQPQISKWYTIWPSAWVRSMTSTRFPLPAMLLCCSTNQNYQQLIDSLVNSSAKKLPIYPVALLSNPYSACARRATPCRMWLFDWWVAQFLAEVFFSTATHSQRFCYRLKW